MIRTYGEMYYAEDKPEWIVQKLEPHVALKFKQLFPKIKKNSAGPFSIVDNLDAAADLHWFIQRYRLDMTDMDRIQLEKSAKQFYTEQEEAEKILSPEMSATSRPGLKPGQKLREYQLKAIDFIEKVRALLLVDDVGLGKTYEGLGIALIPDALPLVVVCEPHLQIQWKQKADDFINLNVCCPAGTKPYSLPPADIYIFKYSQLAGWVDYLTQGWIKAIVFDEIQQLRRGRESSKGTAASEICQHVDIRVGLTATPIYNYGIEAFNIIDGFIKPGALGYRDDFIREWCSGDYNDKRIVKDPDALGSYLREAHIFLRRRKSDVGQQAKQLAPHVEWVEPNQKSVADTEALAERLAITTLNGGFFESGHAARELDLRLRQMTGIAKAKATAQYVRMFIEAGTPVILFGWHREVYRIWQEELNDLNPALYTGSETANQKEQAKSDFITGKTDILIMSLRSGAGADGLQHRCSTIIFGEFDWSPKVHEQCIGRVDRDGQTNQVFSFYVATNYGSDPVMIDVLGLKASQSRGIVDPGVKDSNFQSDKDRLKRLAAAYLTSKGKSLSPSLNLAGSAPEPTRQALFTAGTEN